MAVVGARRASSYGLEVARSLGRGLSAAHVTVVSGLALGVDSEAHAGALEASGRTIGVLAGSAHTAYPVRGWRLHAAVARRGAVVSEMPPGAEAHRWCFVARNRIIAALSSATIVVQATERSGSLTTADFAAEIGRAVGAVPGLVTTRLSAGTHGLIQAGAPLIRDAGDALELLAGVTGRDYVAEPAPRVVLAPPLQRLLTAVENGKRHAERARADARAGARGAGRPQRARAPRPDPTRLRRALGAEGQRMTQVSLAPPFWEELTTSAPSERATRVRPPGSTRGVAPSPRNTNGRRSM